MQGFEYPVQLTLVFGIRSPKTNHRFKRISGLATSISLFREKRERDLQQVQHISQKLHAGPPRRRGKGESLCMVKNPWPLDYDLLFAGGRLHLVQYLPGTGKSFH